jgi:hypothetical protein
MHGGFDGESAFIEALLEQLETGIVLMFTGGVGRSAGEQENVFFRGLRSDGDRGGRGEGQCGEQGGIGWEFHGVWMMDGGVEMEWRL